MQKEITSKTDRGGGEEGMNGPGWPYRWGRNGKQVGRDKKGGRAAEGARAVTDSIMGSRTDWGGTIAGGGGASQVLHPGNHAGWTVVSDRV